MLTMRPESNQRASKNVCFYVLRATQIRSSKSSKVELNVKFAWKNIYVGYSMVQHWRCWWWLDWHSHIDVCCVRMATPSSSSHFDLFLFFFYDSAHLQLFLILIHLMRTSMTTYEQKLLLDTHIHEHVCEQFGWRVVREYFARKLFYCQQVTNKCISNTCVVRIQLRLKALPVPNLFATHHGTVTYIGISSYFF